MDEKGANTFPFHNLPPNSKTSLKVFPVLFHLSFWIKEKSVATLANRNICDQTQTLKSVLPPYHRTGDSAREKFKSGVTLGLEHIYLLSLLDLYALRDGYLFGFESSTRIWNTI